MRSTAHARTTRRPSPLHTLIQVGIVQAVFSVIIHLAIVAHAHEQNGVESVLQQLLKLFGLCWINAAMFWLVADCGREIFLENLNIDTHRLSSYICGTLLFQMGFSLTFLALFFPSAVLCRDPGEQTLVIFIALFFLLFGIAFCISPVLKDDQHR